MDFIPKAARGRRLGGLPTPRSVPQTGCSCRGHFQSGDFGQPSGLTFCVWRGPLPGGFAFFLDNPSTLYMFISKEKGDECLVGVVMLFLSGQNPSFCFEVCHHIACLNAFFFFSRHSALSNWDILLLHHTKSPYMNAHLSQLTRKAFKVHHPCSRAKAKKLGPTKCPILPPFKSAAKHWSPWLSADKYENGQRNAH